MYLTKRSQASKLEKHFKRNKVLMFFVVTNTVIFLALSLLHFYWAVGGKLWLEDVLPTNSRGTARMNPGLRATLIVAIGLLAFALLTAGNQGLFERYIKRKYFRYGALMIAVVFLLRAVGDFKLVGFFKTIDKTRFAINDSKIFSPLCLFVAVVSFVIYVSSRNRLKH